MKRVHISELKNHLSGYLQLVRDGEEIVIRDGNVPVARMLPFREDAEWEREAKLVAAGLLKMPEKEMDWDAFFRLPAGNVSTEVAVEAAIERRGDR